MLTGLCSLSIPGMQSQAGKGKEEQAFSPESGSCLPFSFLLLGLSKLHCLPIPLFETLLGLSQQPTHLIVFLPLGPLSPKLLQGSSPSPTQSVSVVVLEVPDFSPHPSPPGDTVGPPYPPASHPWIQSTRDQKYPEAEMKSQKIPLETSVNE